HNVKREDPDLLSFDPQARLDYVTEKGLPFLQATTLYGAINREHWYNGDYEKKYGDLVKPARNDIREAVQLCAVECAQGRRVKDWELESIMAYLWEIGLQIKDLDLSEKEVDIINDAILNSTNQATAAALITTKYSKESPATFLLPPDDRSAGSGLEGDPKNGRLIYEGSCLHCHYQKRYTFFPLDRGKMSFTHLSRKIPTYSRQSLYQVVRWGTFSKFGKQSYMPRYTEEKMSVQQLADLRAYIDEQAETL
ncbi:MAG: cytochrome c, partial [Bacteroidota bacterium]